jgi:LDH2 family malate/lactate/ureidoglycolate dehydrogenase
MAELGGEGEAKFYPEEKLREQISVLMRAWGMPEDYISITANAMADADACGIDTHGISMLPPYFRRQRNKFITLDGPITVLNETPVSALVDGGGGLGYVPGVTATNLAIKKAKEVGMASCVVRNSAHFGATGYYSRMIASEGLVGMATTSAVVRKVAPTFGKDPKFSTNPIAFAAPTNRNNIFSLDMATTTVAGGKIRNKYNESLPLPVGWANDADGNPTTNATLVVEEEHGGTQTPLGGTRDLGGHKGYGLAMMVEILSCCFSGARIMTGQHTGEQAENGSMDVGHFFLAIDPKIFNPDTPFEDTLDQMIDDLHATTPVDPDQPVMVAGEPEEIMRAERKETGIPVPAGLRSKIEEVCRESNAEFFFV